MDVAWTFDRRPGAVTVRIDHDFAPPWPLVGGVVADRVIGPHFVAAIAGKTLATIKAIVEDRDPRFDAGRPAAVMKQRVAITGIGAITPIGIGVEELWDGVRCGRSAIRTITRFDPTHISSKVAGEIDFDPLDYMAPKRARRLDRFSQFALVCAQMALDDAGLAAAARPRATARASTSAPRSAASPSPRSSTRDMCCDGPHRVNPLLALSVFGGAASSNVDHRARADRSRRSPTATPARRA